MNQLDQFCNLYLPQYFALKYKEGNIKREFFEYKNQGNVFELTGRIFSLVDQLFTANPSLQPTDLISQYFLFMNGDFSEACKDLRDESNQHGAKKAIRKILKRMEDHHRQFFQIFIKLIYLYFDSKQKEDITNLKKRQHRYEYKQRIPVYYKYLRLQAELNDNLFVPSFFMDYVMTILLNMKPNQKFLKILQEMLVQFEFPENIHDKITSRIKQIIDIQTLKANLNPKRNNFFDDSKSQTSKKSLTQIQTKIDSNEGTPVKDKQLQKNEHKTLQSTDKKQNMISKHYQNQTIPLESMKLLLNLQRKSTAVSKQRTLYLRSKYFVSKNTLMNNSKVSLNVSKMKQAQESRFNQLSRSYSSRCLDVVNYQDETILAGATPKPKKKVKTQNASTTLKFDQDGNFIKKR